METHEDERRTLIEWIKDEPFRSAKVVIAKKEAELGNHYHRNKDETFLLLKGVAKRVKIGDVEELNVEGPKKWIVLRNSPHTFVLERGAILLGVGSKPFDPKDEISICNN